MTSTLLNTLNGSFLISSNIEWLTVNERASYDSMFEILDQKHSIFQTVNDSEVDFGKKSTGTIE